MNSQHSYSCPKCSLTDHSVGYGYAAGPLGSYTFCNGCDELIDFAPDTEGLTEEETMYAEARAEKHLREVWGDKYAINFPSSPGATRAGQG